MHDLLIRVLGQLESAYCVLQSTKIVWANSAFLRFISKDASIISRNFFDTVKPPKQLKDILHDRKAGIFKFKFFDIDVQYIDKFALLRFECHQTPEQKLFDILDRNRGIVFSNNILCMKINMVADSYYTKKGEVNPSVPGLLRWLKNGGLENGIILFQLQEKNVMNEEITDLGFLLFRGHELADVLRVSERKFNEGYRFKALLVSNENGRYELKQPTHSEYLDVQYWPLKKKVKDVLSMQYKSGKKQKPAKK